MTDDAPQEQLDGPPHPVAAPIGPPTPSRPDSIEGDWHTLSPDARTVRMIAAAITGLVLSLPASLALWPVLGAWTAHLGVSLAIAIALPALFAALARVRWRHTRWKLDAQGFHVRRGWLFHAEVLIPRSRVQHLDIQRGPLERRFELATLIVHTAGSQTPALQQSGLADADAVALRDQLVPATSHGSDAL